MRNIKFNKFERIAGLFVLTCVFGFIFSLVGDATFLDDLMQAAEVMGRG
jgi:hypothetical protein